LNYRTFENPKDFSIQAQRHVCEYQRKTPVLKRFNSKSLLKRILKKSLKDLHVSIEQKGNTLERSALTHLAPAKPHASMGLQIPHIKDHI
jgi:hypothetical protein